jgi:tetratricopeptide (TPR) repeat protein
MRLSVIRSVVCAASLALLVGCAQTVAENAAPNNFADNGIGEVRPLPEPIVQNASLISEGPGPIDPNAPLLGNDQHDDLSLGKKHFRARDFGLAERSFRRAVEMSPRDAEAWIGLAASYDRLKRFDEADRAYKQAISILGPTPEVLNNQGYSYLLRGDYRTARKKFLAAQAKDPGNPRIARNIQLMEASLHEGKGIAAQ